MMNCIDPGHQDYYGYDVFISSKSEDYAFGHVVYEYLMRKGVKAFFADQELRKLGLADYGNVIDRALDVSKHLIVVASSADFTKEKYSPYVYYEWKTFSEEKRSGRKTGNILTVVPDKSIVKSLPIALRNVQSFTYNEYQEVYNYVIGDSQSDPKPGPFRRIKNFILNFRLGKNFGCVVSIVFFVFLGAVITPLFFLHKSSDSDSPVFEQYDSSIKDKQYNHCIRRSGRNFAHPNSSLAPREGNGDTSAVPASCNLMDFEPFIYFVKVVKIAAYVPEDSLYELNDGKWEYFFGNEAPIATGFITDDGYFFTARQVVEPWAYYATEDMENNPFTVANILHQSGARIEVTLIVENRTGDQMTMVSSDFKVVRQKDITKDNENGIALQLAKGNDYAYIKVNVNSTMLANSQLGHYLEVGTRLETLSFPYGKGKDKNDIRPQCTFMITSSVDLSDGVVFATSEAILEGNAGSPVFVNYDGIYYVVGLITFSEDNKCCIVIPSESDFLR